MFNTLRGEIKIDREAADKNIMFLAKRALMQKEEWQKKRTSVAETERRRNRGSRDTHGSGSQGEVLGVGGRGSQRVEAGTFQERSVSQGSLGNNYSS